MDDDATDWRAGASEDNDNGPDAAQYDSHRLGYNPQVQNGAYDPQLETVRMESIRKIRGRFEHIYQKYGKDFDGVADEIDMATGVIIVNNGHLQNMEHEVDAGNGDALALSRTFEDEEEDEEDDYDEEDGSSGSDIEMDAGQDIGNDSTSVSSDNPDLDFTWQENTAASLTSPDEDGSAPLRLAERPSTPSKDAKHRRGKGRGAITSAPSDQDSASDDIFGQMPGLKDSMLALQDKYRNGQDMAPDDIQALGMSIANQLASFITGGKGSKKRKRQCLPHRLESAESLRGRRRRRDHSSIGPVAPTPARSPGSKSLWAPLHEPKGQKVPKKKEPKEKVAEENAAEEAGDDSLIDSIVLQTIMHQSALEPDELQGPTTVRSCSNCKTTETLYWRRGPTAVDLCNNCGMYYYRYGLMRPLQKSTLREKKASSPETEAVDPRCKRAPYSANTSRPLDGINLFGLHFSVREDAQIIKLKEIDRLTWDEIAMQHPGRTPFALQCRYSKMLAGKPCEARDVLSSRGYQFYVDADGHTVARRMGPFNEEEDDLLLKLREEDGLEWDAVALELPGRTADDVEQRYDEMAKEYLGERREAPMRSSKPKPKSRPKKRRNSNASDRSRSRYTPDEDNTILKLREDDKMSWQDVAKQMPGRTLASVQRHYSRDIGPYGRSRSSTPRGSPAPDELPRRLRKYTEEEDATLMRLRDEEELEWHQIAEHYPDRSASSLENRYYYKIRKDDSRDSSPAGSVGSSRRRSGSLLAIDLEAQLEAAANTSPEGEIFTEAEDNLIVKLRELECLSWDQIAAEMPGRDVSSISCRYYQYLLPRKVPEIREAKQTLDPALQPPILEEEFSASQPSVTDARPPQKDTRPVEEDGPFDGTSKERQVSFGKATPKSKKRKSDVLPRGRAKTSGRSDAPMLRRALQTNLNRRSEPQLAAPTETPDMSTMTDGANDDVLVDDDELPNDHSFDGPALLPSASPSHPGEQPPVLERELRSAAKPMSMYPDTPLRRVDGRGSGLLPLEHALYVTPSRYQTQSHPYFLPNAASPEARVTSAPRNGARAKNSGGESDVRDHELNEEIAFEGGRRPSRKRRRAPKTPRATRPQETHVDATDDDDIGLSLQSDDDDDNDEAGEYFTSRKKRRKVASDAQRSFRGQMQAPVLRRDESEVLAARSRAHSPEDETEEEDIEMPDLGTDDDEDSSDSDEEEEDDDDDDELRCKPRERSPLFDPRNTIEEAKQKKEAPPRRKSTAPAKSGDGNRTGDADKEIDISTLPPEQRLRPDISWTQLNFLALKARAPEPIYTREIYAYLEEKWPYFRFCKGHWRDSIRGNLSTRPEFVKHSDESKAALWRLADPNQEAIIVPKGSRRGRCPNGVERGPKEAKVPKKRGRPSNASKGLPLKRIYKRNYIPVSERKKVTALDAAAAAEGAQAVATTGDLQTFGDPAMPPADANVGSPALAAAGIIDGRPTRPSTIEDSDADEQLEFVEGPPDVVGEIKTESQLPQDMFAAPIVNMTATSSIDKGSGVFSTDGKPATPPIVLSSDITPATTRPGPGLSSSSPALQSSSANRLPWIRGKDGSVATPGTARSTLFRQLAPAPASSAMKASPAFAQIATLSSRVGTPSGLRRVVQTPVRDAEESEDELA